MTHNDRLTEYKNMHVKRREVESIQRGARADLAAMAEESANGAALADAHPAFSVMTRAAELLEQVAGDLVAGDPRVSGTQTIEPDKMMRIAQLLRVARLLRVLREAMPDAPAITAAPTPEQAARDLLERMGVEDAQTFTAGDVAELACLIARVQRLQPEPAANGLSIDAKLVSIGDMVAEDLGAVRVGAPCALFSRTDSERGKVLLVGVTEEECRALAKHFLRPVTLRVGGAASEEGPPA